MTSELKKLIEESERILITSHISPDGDSVSSSLLLYAILTHNHPNKEIAISMEEEPFGLNFLYGYKQIKFQPFQLALAPSKPELLFILDASSVRRVTRHPELVQKDFDERKFKIAIIDHHEGLEFDQPDFYFNESSPAVTLDIYSIFIERLGYQKPPNYAQTALTGIYTDTGGFIHRNLNFEKVFETIPKLLADGADIEEIANSLTQISDKSLEILRDLLNNLVLEDGYVYSFISDKLATKENHEALVQATDVFRSDFIRNIEGRPWGFVVYRDVLASQPIYSVSFRAKTDTKDVSRFASLLGGGGHKPAAGAKFEARDVHDALEKVLATIEQSPSS